MDPQSLVDEHLAPLGLHSSTLQYFVDIFTDFDEDDEEEVYDAILPFLEDETELDDGQIKSLSRTIFRVLCPDAATDDENGASAAVDKLSAPVNMSELHKEIDADVKNRMQWMVKESTVNADRFNKPIEKAQSKRKHLNKMSELNANEVEEMKARKSVPSTFVKKYRPPGHVPVKEVQIRNFDVNVQGKLLIANASLTLAYGRKYGFVGRNGAGKSSLLRAMADGDVAMPDVDFLLVEQEVVGDDTFAIDSVLEADVTRTHFLQEEQRIVSALNQPGSLTEENKAELEKELARVYEELALNDSDGAVATAASILAGLGFTPAMQKMRTREFSGGWRMRLALARALFCQPDLLMLDEPTNMLDVQFEGDAPLSRDGGDVKSHLLWDEWDSLAIDSSSPQFKEAVLNDFTLLADPPSHSFLAVRCVPLSLTRRAVLWLEEYLRLKWSKTLFIVSHDREFLNYVVTDIIHLHDKQLHPYPGNYDSFEQVRNERLKQQQRAHDAQIAHKAHVEKFINRFRYNANRAAQVQSRIKALAKMAPVPSVVEDPSFAFSFPQPVGEVAPPIIRLNGVKFGYDPEHVLFPHIELSVDMDSRIAFVGGNGQGKTTVLKLLTEELTPLDGYVQVNPRARIATFSQHHMDQMPLGVSAFEFLQQSYPGRDRAVYQEGLGRYGIVGDMAFQRISTLSGGQKSRVAFAHMAMMKPHLMILDEPTNHLDIDTVSVLAQALNEYQGGVVLVSHDERLIGLVCDQIWVVHEGTVVKYEHDFNQYKRQVLKTIQI